MTLGLVFGYSAIDRWLPLGAWNGDFGFPVDNPQAGLDIVVLCVVAGLFVAVRREIWPAMTAGTALLGLWCYFHVTTWWWPYVRGVEAGRDLTFHDQFRDHVQLLPRAGMHIPPDGAHIAIDVLVVPARADPDRHHRPHPPAGREPTVTARRHRSSPVDAVRDCWFEPLHSAAVAGVLPLTRGTLRITPPERSAFTNLPRAPRSRPAMQLTTGR